MSCYDHNRVRSKTIAFRITPELNEQINLIVAASGMTKQDYITSKLLDLEVTIVPSTYTYAALRDEMREVCRQLNRIRNGCEPLAHRLVTRWPALVLRAPQGSERMSSRNLHHDVDRRIIACAGFLRR